MILTAFLARKMSMMQNRYWSYRFVFVPETIGAIAYCAQNETALKKIDMGLVITTVGGPGKLGYKQSFNESHQINRLVEESLQEQGADFEKYPFDIHGSDERQYSTLGFRINVATVCRDKYYEYVYYHSSLDDLNFVNGEQVATSLAVYIRIIEKFEAMEIYRNENAHCEVMLSRHNLYPEIGGTQVPSHNDIDQLDLLLWLLFLCDGNTDLESVAIRLGVPLESLRSSVNTLQQKGFLVRV